ncbi:MAG: hypothetical protein OEL66_03405, partial [Desulfobulbaceae bacterium]|nr:hypothetical protein [Desulfobulbaceae bacterium]
SHAAREGLLGYQQALKKDLFVVPKPEKMQEEVTDTSSEISAGPATTWAQPELPLAPLESREPLPVDDLPSFTTPELVQDDPVLAENETASPQPSDVEASPDKAESLQPIGQLLDTYILCESVDGLVAIDQHAAHERLLFEKMKRQYAAGSVARQTLLFPKVIEFDVEEMRLLERYKVEISALGVDIEPFGGDSYVVKAVPAIVSQQGEEMIVRDLLAELAVGSGGAGARIEAVLASMACKAAIKAGHALQPQEISALLQQMREADVFSHCPHGRPVVKKFSGSEIKRWFYRG